MRIWRFHEFGDLKNLKLEETAVPEPGEDEALVKLEYAALNPADAFLIKGLYPRPGKPPMAVGRDGCGTIEQPGSDGRFQKGDRVIILRSEIGVTRNGTLAEYVVVPTASLAPLPDGWTAREGAAAPLVFLTAWQGLVDIGDIRPGHTVLITGTSGGVGTAGLLLARAFGALTVGMSRSEQKRKELKRLGADVVVASEPVDEMEKAIKDQLKGGRVDLVLENLGGPYLQSSLNLLREDGRIAVVGLLAGLKSELTLGLLLFKHARIQGVQVGAYTAQQSQQAWAQVVKRLESINARPIVDQVFAMADTPAAFDCLARGPLGKVLIDVNQ